MESKHFRPYEPDQSLLLPPSLNDWLPEDHLAFFIRDVVGELDLSAILKDYEGSKGGQPPYNAGMMVRLLLYAYCVGVPSSRKIEKATHERVPFRVISANQHPDHDTICEFRKRHLSTLSDLFVQILELCRKAGLVKLGHVALDGPSPAVVADAPKPLWRRRGLRPAGGTKVRANASKHKAMSYGRMKKKGEELEGEVAELMAKAEAVDAEEDARYGKGKRGDELPEELRFRKRRLLKIREAMAELEAEAKAEAEKKRAEMARKEKQREKDGRPPRGRGPKPPSEEPKDSAQRPLGSCFPRPRGLGIRGAGPP